MKIPYGHQSLSEADIKSVLKILHSDFLTQGETVPMFESAISKFVGSEYGVATNNGTSALHIACKALGLKKNDWLWTSPNSFVASANAALYCNAKVDFIDIDPVTWNMDVASLKNKLKDAELKNILPKIIVPVHFGGLSCEMKEIKELSDKYGFKILEDACHALGGKYLDQNIGSCSYSDICVFSFHPVKSITTAEGGMAITNNKELFQDMKALRTHGMERRNLSKNNDLHGPWISEMTQLGYNYRMNDIQAALGISQLDRLANFINKRNKIAQYYHEELSKLPLQLPANISHSYSAFHLYVVRLDLNSINKSRDEIFNELLDCGIGVSIHYRPIHLHPFYKKIGFRKGDFPESEKYYSEAITLPIFANLTQEQSSFVVQSLQSIVS